MGRDTAFLWIERPEFLITGKLKIVMHFDSIIDILLFDMSLFLFLCAILLLLTLSRDLRTTSL